MITGLFHFQHAPSAKIFRNLLALFCPALASFLAAALLSSCTVTNRTANTPVLEVNEHVITAKELAQKLARRLKGLDALAAKDPGNDTRAKEKILRDFIVQSVIDDFAKINNIIVTDAEIDKEADGVRANYPDDLSFRRELAGENLSFSDWRSELHETLLSAKVFKKIGENIKKPTEAEVARYYGDNKDRWKRKERIYLRQIVLDDLTKAKAVHDEVVKSKDFAELAKKYSVSPEAKSGGVVGWIERGSVDIFDKAFLLPVGGTSAVLESSYGFHIFKVDRKAAAGVASLEEVRPEIIQQLTAQKEQVEFMGWLDKQIRHARVLRNNDLIRAITVETKGQK